MGKLLGSIDPYAEAGPDRNFDAISPVDCRYFDAKTAAVLSERAYIAACCAVEVAAVMALAKMRVGGCNQSVVRQVIAGARLVTAERVYQEEEKVTKHDIRALVNCICFHLPEEVRRWVHLCLTSYDVIDIARALMYRRATDELILPRLESLIRALMVLAWRYSDTVQVGRTHGQHAVPVTFGLAMALYVSRLASCHRELVSRRDGLCGKISGAAGAYNAASVVPGLRGRELEFEANVLSALGLPAAEITTQIIPPDPLIRYLNELAIIGGVLGNLGRDMRSLMRTEINEVREAITGSQVGSSTMAHKRNPMNFENAESLMHVVQALSFLSLLIQVSEHQRDLTNSAAARFLLQIPAILSSSLGRMNRVMPNLEVDLEAIAHNLGLQGDLILAEPVYIILAFSGHPDAHESVRRLSRQAQAEGTSLRDVINAGCDGEATRLIAEGQMDTETRALLFGLLDDPIQYTGIAGDKSRGVVRTWARRFKVPMRGIKALAAGEAE